MAKTRPEGVKQLFRVQLLGKTVNDVDLALSLLIDMSRDLVACDRALLFWKQDPDGAAELTLTRGEGEGTAVPPGSEEVRQAVADAERPFLLSRSKDARPPASPLLEAFNASSLLSMPVYAGEQVMGTLLLVRSSAEPFDSVDAHLLRVFSVAFEPILENLSQGGRLRDYAFLDGTTGLFNRRYLEQHLEREIDRARRNNVCVAVMLIEIDGFDALRAEKGHTGSEHFVEAVAGRLRHLCRKSDTLARHKDSTFALILPQTGKEILPAVAKRVVNTLRRNLGASALELEVEKHEFNLCASVYPEDSFSVESLLASCYQGLETARSVPDTRYYQSPAPQAQGGEEDIFDGARAGLLRERNATPARLLKLFARLCLDSVPADRVSIMIREADSLVIQVALGFEGQDEVVRTTRVPLTGSTISAWVAQRREPLLVAGTEELSGLARETRTTYRSDSFISFPLLDGDQLLGVIHFSNRSDGRPFSADDLDAFSPVARTISGYLSLGRTFSDAQEHFLQNALFRLVEVVERQIPGMENHSREVARLAEATARQMGYGDDELGRLRVSSLLHDLGNASFRSRILAEARALSPRERSLAQRHPLLGWSFLESVPIEEVDRDAILYHHEREDGSGYFGKRGSDIPTTAKILAVADVYQALVSPRPYRPAVPGPEALSYLEGQKGTLFDSEVIEAFRTAVAAQS
ncbi:MAG: diguanylate cyclase [Deltaproteobacteria bacterium]|nr:diguanylate cyclase [Deltaproteobacteria bacterium]